MNRDRLFPPILACCLYLIAGIQARNNWAPTYDEGFHLYRGLHILETGNAELSYNHPPLQNILCAWPVWIHAKGSVRQDIRQAKAPDIINSSSRYAALRGTAFRQDVRIARFGSMLFGLALVAGLTLWTTHFSGPGAGAAAGVGIALLPVWLFHSNLATTDAGLATGAVLGTLAALAFTRTKNPLYLAAAAAAFILAAWCKFSGLLWLLTFCLGSVPLLAWKERRKRLLMISPVSLLVFLMGCAFLYRGTTPPDFIRQHAPDWLSSFPGGDYFIGMLSQKSYVLDGRRVFIAGRLQNQGAYWHAPFAWLCKNPPVWILMSLAALPLILKKIRIVHVAVLLPLTVFVLGNSLLSNLMLGTRHLLPAGLLMIPVATALPGRIRQTGWRPVLLGALIIQSVLSYTLTFPYTGSYMAFWTGGIKNGHHMLVESDYDWGQDLEILSASWPTSYQDTPPALHYFGFVDPRQIYHLQTGPGSVHGFMDYSRVRGSDAYPAWKQAAQTVEGPRVISISTIRLNPYGLTLDLQSDDAIRRFTPGFFLYDSNPDH